MNMTMIRTLLIISAVTPAMVMAAVQPIVIKPQRDITSIVVADGEITLLRTVIDLNNAHLAETPPDKLAFGIEGMTSMQPKGKRTYEVVVEQYAKPVIVRQCLGAEGVNFRLYHSLADKKPFATYYFALGYDVKADCR